METIYNHAGLMWTKTFKKMSWEEAVEFCKNLNYAGYSDWRFPTIQELFLTIDYSKDCPACFLPDTESFYYWSSTTYSYNTGYVWYVHFNSGLVGNYLRLSSYCVRAVRGGQCL